MDVGTATIGHGTRPATTGASAASMPATTTIAWSERKVAASVSSRWMPATPTSKVRRTSAPMSSAVRAASSATGMSEVPADTTPMRAPVGLGAVRETTTARAPACQTASGTASRTARAVSGATRVTSV